MVQATPMASPATRFPFEARVLAVADVYDAMRSGRSYRPALADSLALTYLQEHAGRLFDSRCVEVIREIAAERTDAPQPGAPRPATLTLHKQPSS